MSIVLKNNASNFLATAIDSAQTTLTLTSGASFPTIAGAQYFYATIESTEGTREIVRVNARVGNTLTVVRGQDGTSAASFAEGSRVEARINAASVEDYLDQNAELAQYNQGAGTAVTRTIQERLQDFVSVKDFGAVGDGVTDDTAAIQAALNASKRVYIPPGTYMVFAHTVPGGGLGGVKPNSDSEIIFHRDAFLKAITNDADLYSIIDLTNKTNVRIENCNLIGDRDTHTGTTGEFGMGVFIRNGSNITIDGGKITNCWGDGIYVGQASSTGSPEDVSIRNLVCDNNRRNNLTVIAAVGLYVENCTFSNANGTNPQYGVDIEPNNANGNLQNIYFVCCRFINNVNAGFGINLSGLTSASAFARSISITIQNCFASGNVDNYEVSRCLNPAPGVVEFKECVSSNSDLTGWKLRRLDYRGVKTRLVNPTVIDWNRNGVVGDPDGAAITGFTLSSDPSPTAGFGNIEIINPEFKLNSVVGSGTQRQISLRDTSVGKVTNVEITGVRDYSSNTWNLGNTAEWDLATVSLSTFPFYAEGTWTPSYFAYDTGGDPIVATNTYFAKNGNLITVSATFAVGTNSDNSTFKIGSLPFPSITGFSGAVGLTDYGAVIIWHTDGTSIRFAKADGTPLSYADMSGQTMTFTASYIGSGITFT